MLHNQMQQNYFMAATTVDRSRRSKNSTTIYQEISGTIKWASGGDTKHFSRHKHIYLRCNHVMNKINSDNINFVYVRTEQMAAHFLTK